VAFVRVEPKERLAVLSPSLANVLFLRHLCRPWCVDSGTTSVRGSMPRRRGRPIADAEQLWTWTAPAHDHGRLPSNTDGGAAPDVFQRAPDHFCLPFRAVIRPQVFVAGPLTYTRRSVGGRTGLLIALPTCRCTTLG